MGLKFNPLIFNGFDNTGSGGGGGGGSASFKDPVANFAALPLLGNSDGDVRGTLDTDKLYMWNNTSMMWVDVAGGASGANTALSNLISTSINQDLNPDSDLVRSLGSNTKEWLNLYINNVQTSAPVTGSSNPLNMFTGDVNGAEATGEMVLYTGFAPDSGGESGQFNILTGDADSDSGSVRISTGTSASTQSGSILLITGNSPAATGSAGFITGDVEDGESGGIGLSTGSATVSGGNSGGISLLSGNAQGASGTITIRSGQGVDESGGIDIRTGSASAGPSGQISLVTESQSPNLDTGDILLQTGTVSGTGVRGQISIFSRQINVNSQKIVNLTDPTNAQDAATKAYVDSAGSGANTALSNLITTSINQDLLPDSNNSRNIGSSLLTWASVSARTYTSDDDVNVLTADQIGTGNTSKSINLTTGQSDDSGSGGIQILTGQTTNSDSGGIFINSGQVNVDGTLSGEISVQTGYAAGGGSSGGLNLASGPANIDSGAVTINSGDANTGLSGEVNIHSGNTAADSGIITLASGNSSAGFSGDLNIHSGNASGLTGTININTGDSSADGTGNIEIRTGSGSVYPSGDVLILTGNEGGAVNSGQILLRTGSSGATRGPILMQARLIQIGSSTAPAQIDLKDAANDTAGRIETNATSPTGNNQIGIAFHNPSTSTTTGHKNLALYTDDQASATKSGSLFLETGNNTTGDTGSVEVTTGSTSGSNKVSGDIRFATGEATDVSGTIALSTSNGVNGAGNVELTTGSASAAPSGSITLVTGSQAVDLDSGDIQINTGTVSGTGIRGQVTVNARQLSMSNKKIVAMADPTNAQDAATKAYVDAQVAGGTVAKKEIFTLSGTDITNQYVDLLFTAETDSILAWAKGGPNGIETDDYTLSIVLGKTRITFNNDWATGGADALIAGDILVVQYRH